MNLITKEEANNLIANAGTYNHCGVTTPCFKLGDWFDSLASLIGAYCIDYGMTPDDLLSWLDDCDGTCVVYDLESDKFTLLL